VRYGERKSFPFWVRLRATEEKWHWIAAEPLAAGRPIAAGQIQKVKARTAVALAGQRKEDGPIEGLVPRRAVPAGGRISPPLLDRPKEIRRGDRVKVEVAEGRTRLSLECKAESGGRRGDRILLLNETSGRKFLAEIAGAGKAVVRGAALAGEKK
jgi:flagella basal body P-ring formation protein FlgA